MVYYKILPEYDGQARKDGTCLIGNELYTKTEMERYCIPYSYTRQINMPQHLTHWFCGARWQDGKVPER